MGTLTFLQPEVHPLDEHFASTTGHFHLERSIAGGGNADAYFMLVVETLPPAGRFVRYDTAALPANEQK
jgi:hypothetical protein